MSVANPNCAGGSDLRARREAAGLTRQQLAQLADCSMSVVGLLEGGWAPRHSEVLSRIDEALKAAAEGGGA